TQADNWSPFTNIPDDTVNIWVSPLALPSSLDFIKLGGRHYVFSIKNMKEIVKSPKNTSIFLSSLKIFDNASMVGFINSETLATVHYKLKYVYGKWKVFILSILP